MGECFVLDDLKLKSFVAIAFQDYCVQLTIEIPVINWVSMFKFLYCLHTQGTCGDTSFLMFTFQNVLVESTIFQYLIKLQFNF